MPTAADRSAEWSEAVFAAVAALRRAMTCGETRLEVTAAQADDPHDPPTDDTLANWFGGPSD